MKKIFSILSIVALMASFASCDPMDTGDDTNKPGIENPDDSGNDTPTPPTEGEGEGNEDEGGQTPSTPAEPIVLTLDFSTQPFTTDMPDTPTATETPVSYTLKDTEYVFEMYSTGTGDNSTSETKNGYKLAGGALRFCEKTGQKGYLKVPGIPEYALTKVELTTTNTADKYFNIYSGSPIEDGTTICDQIKIPASGSATADLEDTVAGESYYLYTVSVRCQISLIKLTYTK